MLLNVRLKKNSLFENTCWKDHYLVDSLKTLSVTCAVSQWKPAILRQNWSINTFSKKILPFYNAQRGRAWAKCFICQFSVHIKQLLRECHSRVKAEKFSTNHDCAQHLKLLHCWLNCLTTAGKKNWWCFPSQEKKPKNITHVLRGSTCAFCFFLVCLLTHCWKVC